MDIKEFEKIVSEEWEKMPERYASKLRNVALIIDLEPSEAMQKEVELEEDDTLLGLYQGVPLPERGADYGTGPTMPDTITLFMLPILEVAKEDGDSVSDIVRETLWHEVAHYFGFDENDVSFREGSGTNKWK